MLHRQASSAARAAQTTPPILVTSCTGRHGCGQQLNTRTPMPLAARRTAQAGIDKALHADQARPIVGFALGLNPRPKPHAAGSRTTLAAKPPMSLLGLVAGGVLQHHSGSQAPQTATDAADPEPVQEQHTAKSLVCAAYAACSNASTHPTGLTKTPHTQSCTTALMQGVINSPGGTAL